jgi:excisionase family DNA binding protein
MAGEERWVGVNDVAAHLGVAKDSVYRWIEERGLPGHRVGRLFRFKLSEIDEWVRQDNDLFAPRSVSPQAGRGKAPSPAHSRTSSKSQMNASRPKRRSRTGGG